MERKKQLAIDNKVFMLSLNKPKLFGGAGFSVCVAKSVAA